MLSSLVEGRSADFPAVSTPGILVPERAADHTASVPDLAEKQQD